MKTASDQGILFGYETVFSELTRNIREGHYCTILGPQLFRKSDLLHSLQNKLKTDGLELCLFLDLSTISFSTDEDFLNKFATSLLSIFEHEGYAHTDLEAKIVTSPRELQNFIVRLFMSQNQNLVLLLDHIESIRKGPLITMLQVLRAIFNERVSEARNKLIVVTASSLSVAELNLGPNSPFNIARVIFLTDLNVPQSKELLESLTSIHNIKFEEDALERFIVATGGDRYLIPKLYLRCKQRCRKAQVNIISKKDVDDAIIWFCRYVAPKYRPLRVVVRALESSPNHLLNVLLILKGDRVPRSELNIGIEDFPDSMTLTGAVKVDLEGGIHVYSIRNEIYKIFLKEIFQPDKVVNVLSLASLWSQAIRYLEDEPINKSQYRTLLLETIIHAVNAAGDTIEDGKWLAKHIVKAFDFQEACFYLFNPERSQLIKYSHFSRANTKRPDRLPLSSNNPVLDDLKRKDPYIGTDESGNKYLSISLLFDGKDPLGLVYFYRYDSDQEKGEYLELLELLAFIRHISRAIAQVQYRDRKILQLSKLNQMGKEVTSSLDLKGTLQTTVEKAIEAVSTAEKGSLFLLDENTKELIIHAQKGYRQDIAESLKLKIGEGVAGWVFKNRKPVIVDDVKSDRRFKKVFDPEIEKEKSLVCVPLEAWGSCIGILCLDNLSITHAFHEDDLQLLDTFGAQAAIALQNARLYNELYCLGMRINQNNLSALEIYNQTSKSIVRVSDAKATNLLLLPKENDPANCVNIEAIQSESFGLKENYKHAVQPRSNGLTYKVLITQKPQFVSNPSEQPGINPLALAQGMRASLCLPMMKQNIIFGVLFIHYDKDHEFSLNEIEMLSLFTNQAALAIENTHQREALSMYEKVAWIGIAFTSLVHRVNQKAAAIQKGISRLREEVIDKGISIEDLDRIAVYATNIGDILNQTRELSNLKESKLNINELIMEFIPNWCAVEPSIIHNLTGVKPCPDAVVLANGNRLIIALEILITNAIQAMSTLSEKYLIVTSKISDRKIFIEITNPGKIPINLRNFILVKPIPKKVGETGTGIGLLIVRYTMRYFGGDIEFNPDDIKESTSFRFWLPQNC